MRADGASTRSLLPGCGHDVDRVLVPDAGTSRRLRAALMEAGDSVSLIAACWSCALDCPGEEPERWAWWCRYLGVPRGESLTREERNMDEKEKKEYTEQANQALSPPMFGLAARRTGEALGSEEKLERLRDVLRGLHAAHSRVEEASHRDRELFMQHRHCTDGCPVVSVRDMTFRAATPDIYDPLA